MSVLNESELELLACLAEEMGEVIQVIGKIIRHGYESIDSEGKNSMTNRCMLEYELGDVRAIMIMLSNSGAVSKKTIHEYADDKQMRMRKYLRHN